MPRRRWLTLISVASFVLFLGGGGLLTQAIGSGFSHPLSNPLLFIGQLVLSLIMLFFGFLGVKKTSREQQDANYSSRDFGAHEAFQQIRAGIMPSDWSVFRAGRKKVVGKSIILSCILLFYALFLGSLLWFDQKTVYETSLLSLYPCLLFLAALLSPFWTWRRMKNQVLVVMPEGFLQGNCQKPEAALRVKYRDIQEIKVIGETVKVFGKDNWGARTVTFYTFVPRPKEASATLLAAFTHYKACHPDEITVTALSTFSLEKHERKRG